MKKLLSAAKGLSGFTVAEIVVVLAVIIGVSSMVLVSFSGLNEGTSINRSVRELALALRKTQNMALAVTQIDVGGSPVIPSAVGVRLKKDEASYFLFADVNPVDNMYNGSTEKISGADTFLQPRVRINRIYNQDNTEYNIAYILFASPEATIILTHNEDPNELPPVTLVSGDRISIEFSTASGQKKTVIIRESGQISIK